MLCRRACRTTASIEGSTRWEKRALVGIPDDAINAAARTWRATLIILGIGRHSRVDRVFGSETAVAVARRAAIPIVAVPSRVRSLPKRALAALDFTPASMAAAVRAASLLAADGELVLAHVGAFEGVKPRAGDLVDIYRAGAETKLRQAVHALSRRTKRQISSVMLGGEPADALVAYARKARCDLIALGGHDQPLLDRVLLGSVRTRVLRSAHCSVLISPPEGVP